MDDCFFPALNATLNGASGVMILVGRGLIARGRIAAHKAVMISAFVTSSAFLASYLYYHFVVRHGQPTHYPHQGWMRTAYFALLASHTVLAAAIVPLILISLRRGLRRDDARHRAIARWTYPLWLYVSATGVLIYFMLYRW